MKKPFKVKDYMSVNLVTFTPDMPVLEAIHLLAQRKISGAPVVDEQGDLVGMLSQRDCMGVALEAIYHGVSAGAVSEFMTHDVKTVEADMDLLEVVELFIDHTYGRYPVLKSGRIVGQISRADVFKAMISFQPGKHQP